VSYVGMTTRVNTYVYKEGSSACCLLFFFSLSCNLLLSYLVYRFRSINLRAVSHISSIFSVSSDTSDSSVFSCNRQHSPSITRPVRHSSCRGLLALSGTRPVNAYSSRPCSRSCSSFPLPFPLLLTFPAPTPVPISILKPIRVPSKLSAAVTLGCILFI